jgi:oxalate decarboxylase
VPHAFSHPLLEQEPVRLPGGTVRIVDARTFPAATTIAAALVELEPGALRELHWHPNADEWQYHLSGHGRMTAFAAAGRARTFDVHAGDVGYVPFAMGHYVQNTGDEPLRFLELFRSDRFADVSLDRWLALTPPALVQAHLGVGDDVLRALSPRERPVVS